MKSLKACAVFLLFSLSAHAGEAAYRLEKTIPLGGGERWDYLSYDAATHRVLIAHGDRVDVVDPDTGKVLGLVSGIDGGTHGVAVAAGGQIGVSDDGKQGQAVLFDLRTFKILHTIATAVDADGIVEDASTHRIFEINGESGTISVIDATAARVVDTIDASEPLEAGVANGAGDLYVLGVDKHEIVDIDVRTNKVAKRFALDGCERPHGIAFDPKANRLFATCVNDMMIVVDAKDGTRIASVPIDPGSDGAVFDTKRRTAISSNGSGTLTVVTESTPGHFERTTVPTKRGARTIAIDEQSGRLFLVTADVESENPPAKPGGRASITYKKGSTALLIFKPTM